MTTLTGILEWPQRAEGRIRQFNGTTLVQSADDPFVPLTMGEQYNLRSGLEVTVEVVQRKSKRRKRKNGTHPKRIAAWRGSDQDRL